MKRKQKKWVKYAKKEEMPFRDRYVLNVLGIEGTEKQLRARLRVLRKSRGYTAVKRFIEKNENINAIDVIHVVLAIGNMSDYIAGLAAIKDKEIEKLSDDEVERRWFMENL